MKTFKQFLYESSLTPQNLDFSKFDIDTKVDKLSDLLLQYDGVEFFYTKMKTDGGDQGEDIEKGLGSTYDTIIDISSDGNDIIFLGVNSEYIESSDSYEDLNVWYTVDQSREVQIGEKREIKIKLM